MNNLRMMSQMMGSKPKRKPYWIPKKKRPATLSDYIWRSAGLAFLGFMLWAMWGKG